MNNLLIKIKPLVLVYKRLFRHPLKALDCFEETLAHEGNVGALALTVKVANAGDCKELEGIQAACAAEGEE